MSAIETGPSLKVIKGGVEEKRPDPIGVLNRIQPSSEASPHASQADQFLKHLEALRNEAA